MHRSKPRFILGLLPVLLGVALPTLAQEGGPTHGASFWYERGSVASGHVTAECTSAGVVFADKVPGVLEFWSQGGRFEKYNTTTNQLVISPGDDDPVHAALTANQTQTNHTLPPGRVRIVWNETGRARFFPIGWPWARPESVEGRFLVNLTARSVRNDPPTGQVHRGDYWVKTPGGELTRYWGGIMGWNRWVRVEDARAEIAGPLTVFLEGATVYGEHGFRQEVPKRYQYERYPPVGNPVAEPAKITYHHALLRLQDARILLERDHPMYTCAGVDWTVEGAFTAYVAQGRVTDGNATLPFERKELTLEGSFALSERPVPASSDEAGRRRMDAQADGSFTAVGLDFAPVEGLALAAKADPLVGIVGSVLLGGVAATLAYAIKSGLFTRILTPNVLQQEKRQRVYEAIRQNPWAGLPLLIRVTGLKRDAVEYHAGVLVRHGKVVRRKQGAAYHFHEASPKVDTQGPVSPLRHDPLAAQVLERLSGGPVQQRDLVKFLQREGGFERTGAWRWLQRLTRAGLVTRRRDGLEVWYECAASKE